LGIQVHAGELWEQLIGKLGHAGGLRRELLWVGSAQLAHQLCEGCEFLVEGWLSLGRNDSDQVPEHRNA
jgi:hypothetical protein